MDETDFHTVALATHIRERATELKRVKDERGENLNIGHIPIRSRGTALLIGSIGEAALASYLEDELEGPMDVYTADDPSEPEEADILAMGRRIDVKTRMGRYPPSLNYWMFVERSAVKPSIDYFAFAWYDRIGKTATLLGFLGSEELQGVAKLWIAGSRLDNGWTIPCDSYGVRIRDLFPIGELPLLLRENGRKGMQGARV
jgi:hypothetical protein